MKQHVTVEQLNELSEKGKEKLSEWFNKNRKDRYVIIGTIGTEQGTEHITSSAEKVYIDIHGWGLPLLSIGQMIEFLDDSDPRICSVPIMVPSSNTKKTYWHLYFLNKHHYNLKLCDGLWKAVKEVLEKDDVTTC